jgi:DHA1 family inner membrane transport protein
VSTPAKSAPFPLVGLLVLAGAIFSSVTSEFLPTGLLPDMARDLHVSVSQVGLLVSIFAGTVVVSTTPLAALTRRYSRKALVVVVLLVNASAGILAAIAPSYEVLIGARVLGGLAHGLFWAVVGAYATHLVPKHQIGRAIAITSAGGTAAFVLGVPIGTALGHALGWRLAFASIAVVMIVLTVMVIRFLPAVSHGVSLATGEIALPARRDRTMPAVLIICLVIVVVASGHNLFYTYIAPWLIGETGFTESAVAPLLFLYGGAGAIGLALAGVLADRSPRRGLLFLIIGILVPVGVLTLFPHVPGVVIASLAVWGAVFGGIPTLLQTRMMHTASAHIRDLAAAFFTTSFNLAIGGGALLGGIMLDRFGLGSLPIADLVFIVVAIVLSLLTNAWLDGRERRA